MKGRINEIEKLELGEAIPTILRLIRGHGFSDFEHWLKLELNGYWDSNPALQENDEVPKYREIVGQHYDDYGRPLIISQIELQYINTTRVRWGVIDLEQMCKKGGNYSFQDPYMIKHIKDFLKVEVTRFSFNAQQLTSVLSLIRTELSERLFPIVEVIGTDDLNSKTEDIIQLKPNIYGLGLDLRALVRKWGQIISHGKDKVK